MAKKSKNMKKETLKHWALERDEEKEEKLRNKSRSEAQHCAYMDELVKKYVEKYGHPPVGLSTWDIEQSLKDE